jgi:hypothetical protein
MAQKPQGSRKVGMMQFYTVDQERKRAGVETRLHARFPQVELDVYNLPGLFRLVAHFGDLQLTADRAIKYNVFSLVKMFAEDIDRATIAAESLEKAS